MRTKVIRLLLESLVCILLIFVASEVKNYKDNELFNLVIDKEVSKDNTNSKLVSENIREELSVKGFNNVVIEVTNEKDMKIKGEKTILKKYFYVSTVKV
jgi:hypothetical protein